MTTIYYKLQVAMITIFEQNDCWNLMTEIQIDAVQLKIWAKCKTHYAPQKWGYYIHSL